MDDLILASISKFYMVMRSSFPAFNFQFDSPEFSIWSNHLKNYKPDAIDEVTKTLPTLRDNNSEPYNFPPSLAVFSHHLLLASAKLSGIADFETIFKRLVKFKALDYEQKQLVKHKDEFLYCLYNKVKHGFYLEQVRFKKIVYTSYINLLESRLLNSKNSQLIQLNIN